jgi:hypothetical protein
MQMPINPLGAAAVFGGQAAVSQSQRTGTQADESRAVSAKGDRDADVVAFETREIDDSGASVEDRDGDGRTPWAFSPPPAPEAEADGEAAPPQRAPGRISEGGLDLVV